MNTGARRRPRGLFPSQGRGRRRLAALAAGVLALLLSGCALFPAFLLTAPAAAEANYGVVSLEEPEKVTALIQQARDRGLLDEDEPLAFDPDAAFYSGFGARDIEYYLDDSLLVLLWKENIENACCTFAEIKVADAGQFVRKLADDRYDAGAQYFATEFAAQTGAVLTLNADFYRFRQYGVVVYERELCRFSETPLYNGLKQYNCIDTLFVTEAGDFLCLRAGEENTPESIRDYVEENDIAFSLAFGPLLVEDHEPLPCPAYPLGEVRDTYSRAAIGQIGPRHYLYMAVNFGTYPPPWNVEQFAQQIARKPVVTAYCLDGGQTAEAVFRGKPYNYIDFGEERRVSDVLCFFSAHGS